MRSVVSIFLLSLLAAAADAQIAISYFPFVSTLSVATNTEKWIWGDYKIATNTFVSNLNMELSPKVNLRRGPIANYYLGPGISFNPANSFSDLPLINGYFLDMGARIKPLKHKHFQVVFEISPYVNRAFTGGNLRTLLGVAYNFGG